MQLVDRMTTDPMYNVFMDFLPGDMQFVNNYHVLHGRRSYVDDAGSGRVRFLKRLWLATDALGPDDRPPQFQRTGAMTHWAAKRSRA